MNVPILIQDNTGLEEADKMNLPFAPKMQYTAFFFHLDRVEAFWVDESENEIVFSYAGADYRTLYKEGTYNLFKSQFV
jgi:hypothetical protein